MGSSKYEETTENQYLPKKYRQNQKKNGKLVTDTRNDIQFH